MVDWGRVKESLTRAYRDIQSNPATSAAVSTALSLVPGPLGTFLLSAYQNSAGSNTDKADTVLRLLQNLKDFDVAKLQEISEALQENRQALLKNQAVLKELVELTKESDARFDERILALAQQNSEILQGVRAGFKETQEVSLKLDKALPLLQLLAARQEKESVPQVPGKSQSPGEALLKQANELVIEATERMDDLYARDKQKIEADFQAMVSSGTLSMEQVVVQIMAEVLDSDSRAKLQEALSVVQRVEKGDPSDVDALLLHFQVSYLLDPADRPGRLKLMTRAVASLGVPTDEKGRLLLAQASYYKAISSDPIDIVSLGTARTIYHQLGREEYVQQIDAAQMAAAQVAQLRPPAANLPNLVGRWSIRFGSGEADMVDLYPNGSFQGAIQRGWERHNVAGQWAFDPGSGTLGLQGIADGVVPFATQMIFRGAQGNVLSGFDAAGDTFVMSRA